MSGTVTYERNGETYSGEYSLAGGIVTLNSQFGQKRTQKGTLTPEHLARMMLAEQVTHHLSGL